jgi:hypothetical protein
MYGKKLLEKNTPLKGNWLYVVSSSWSVFLVEYFGMQDFISGLNLLQRIL